MRPHTRTVSFRARTFSIATLTSMCLATAGAFTANYDESKVPEYTLPDPLVAQDGTKIESAEQWREKRRPEILALFQEHVYGKAPGRPERVSYHVSRSEDALDGKAIRKQVRITLGNQGREMDIDMLVYLPKDAQKPVPIFTGLNFQGNHTIHSDPAIRIPDSWMRPRDGVVDNRSTEKARGIASSRWPVEMILDRGYGLATVYYGDIDPDFDDGFKNGVHALFPEGEGERAGDAWGSIAGWAWGLSRMMDYFQVDPEIDADRVALLGHSRLGKTSLWAGATDPRFAIVISNDSGCGGAALSRRQFGETVERINTSFPHWFCENYTKYNLKEDECPVDQHMLLALVAPRPLYVASAQDDRWADPRGEFLSAKHADPVYRLLTGEGLPAEEMPKVDEPAAGRIGYHIRSGGHDVKDFDWRQYLDFADKHLKK